MSFDWKPGDRAKWLPERPPLGVRYANPPSPQWPTREQMARMDQAYKKQFVTILEVTDGRPTKARGDDGWEFDPSVDIRSLAPASHDGWERRPAPITIARSNR